MKNMRNVSFFSLILLSSFPMVAMQDPELEFPEVKGMEFPTPQIYTAAEQNLKAGYTYMATKAYESIDAAKGVYNENAPKVVEAGKHLVDKAQTEFNAIKRGFALANGTAEPVLDAPATQAVAAELPVKVTLVPDIKPEQIDVILAPVQPNGAPVKSGFFAKIANSLKAQGAQLKEVAKNHPILTAVAVAAVVVPVAYLVYNKIQKSRKKTSANS